MTPKELFEHFMSQGTWVDRETTVDQFVAGNRDKEITNIAVTWMSDITSIKWAIAHDIDLLITHEPTYYNHFKDLEEYAMWESSYPKKITGLKKEKIIRQSDLVIMRNHDVWDLFPSIGIPFAFAKFLGITTPPVMLGNDDYQHRYDIKPIKLGEFAKQIAIKTASLGQQGVRLFGDENQLVSKIGIGTGCGCQITEFMKMDCDVSVICDDGQLYWMDIAFAKDANHPVIQVNHAVSEGPGMVTMVDYINDTFPSLHAVYLPHQYNGIYIAP